MTNATRASSVLDIDMGNSRIKWRLQKQDGPLFGVSDYQSANWLTFEKLDCNPTRVRISCVVRDLRREQITQHCQLQWQVTPEFAAVQSTCGGVTQAYLNKERLGVDRWLGLLAAYQQVGACVLVSCGSAVTVDLLLADGQHVGGYIVPGIAMMHRSLFNGTDAVKVEAAHQLTDLLPGRDTIEAVNKGVIVMIKGLVDYAQTLYIEKTGEPPQILITGGDGETVQRFLGRDSIYNPYLVLDGLAVGLP